MIFLRYSYHINHYILNIFCCCSKHVKRVFNYHQVVHLIGVYTSTFFPDEPVTIEGGPKCEGDEHPTCLTCKNAANEEECLLKGTLKRCKSPTVCRNRETQFDCLLNYIYNIA